MSKLEATPVECGGPQSPASSSLPPGLAPGGQTDVESEGYLSLGVMIKAVARGVTEPPAPATTAAEETARSEDSSTRRNEILDGAAQAFAELGYHRASLRNISTSVGISHPGLLHHFESKSALLDGVIDRLEMHAQDALDRVDELGAEPYAFLNGLAEIWHPASHLVQLLAVLYTDVVNEEHPGRFRMARLRRVHEHALEQCFTKFAERGLLRDGIDPPFASRALLDHVLGHAVREQTVRTMQRQPHDDSPIKDLTKLTGAFLNITEAYLADDGRQDR